MSAPGGLTVPPTGDATAAGGRRTPISPAGRAQSSTPTMTRRSSGPSDVSSVAQASARMGPRRTSQSRGWRIVRAIIVDTNCRPERPTAHVRRACEDVRTSMPVATGGGDNAALHETVSDLTSPMGAMGGRTLSELPVSISQSPTTSVEPSPTSSMTRRDDEAGTGAHAGGGAGHHYPHHPFPTAAHATAAAAASGAAGGVDRSGLGRGSPPGASGAPGSSATRGLPRQSTADQLLSDPDCPFRVKVKAAAAKDIGAGTPSAVPPQRTNNVQLRRATLGGIVEHLHKENSFPPVFALFGSFERVSYFDELTAMVQQCHDQAWPYIHICSRVLQELLPTVNLSEMIQNPKDIPKDGFLPLPLVAWPLQTIEQLTCYYLTAKKVGFSTMKMFLEQGGIFCSGKGALAALGVACSCTEEEFFAKTDWVIRLSFEAGLVYQQFSDELAPLYESCARRSFALLIVNVPVACLQALVARVNEPTEDCVPFSELQLTRVVSHRAAVVTGHPADLNRLDQLLVQFGSDTGVKVHKDYLPASVPENSSFYNQHLKLKLLRAWTQEGLLRPHKLHVPLFSPTDGKEWGPKVTTFMHELAGALTCQQQDLTWSLQFLRPTDALLEFSSASLRLGHMISWTKKSILVIAEPADTRVHSTLPSPRRSTQRNVRAATFKKLTSLNKVLSETLWNGKPRDLGQSRLSTLDCSFFELGLLLDADKVTNPTDLAFGEASMTTMHRSMFMTSPKPGDGLQGAGAPGGGTGSGGANGASLWSAGPQWRAPGLRSPLGAASAAGGTATPVGGLLSAATNGGGSRGAPSPVSLCAPQHYAPPASGLAQQQQLHPPNGGGSGGGGLGSPVVSPFFAPPGANGYGSGGGNGASAIQPPPAFASAAAGMSPPTGEGLAMFTAIDGEALPGPSGNVGRPVAVREGFGPHAMVTITQPDSTSVLVYQVSPLIDYLERQHRAILTQGAVDVTRKLSDLTHVSFPEYTMLLCPTVFALFEFWDTLEFLMAEKTKAVLSPTSAGAQAAGLAAGGAAFPSQPKGSPGTAAATAAAAGAGSAAGARALAIARPDVGSRAKNRARRLTTTLREVKHQPGTAFTGRATSSGGSVGSAGAHGVTNASLAGRASLLEARAANTPPMGSAPSGTSRPALASSASLSNGLGGVHHASLGPRTPPTLSAMPPATMEADVLGMVTCASNNSLHSSIGQISPTVFGGMVLAGTGPVPEPSAAGAAAVSPGPFDLPPSVASLAMPGSPNHLLGAGAGAGRGENASPTFRSTGPSPSAHLAPADGGGGRAPPAGGARDCPVSSQGNGT